MVIQELSYMGFGFLPCVIIWKGLVLAFQGTTGCPGILMILLRVAFLIKNCQLFSYVSLVFKFWEILFIYLLSDICFGSFLGPWILI